MRPTKTPGGRKPLTTEEQARRADAVRAAKIAELDARAETLAAKVAAKAPAPSAAKPGEIRPDLEIEPGCKVVDLRPAAPESVAAKPEPAPGARYMCMIAVPVADMLARRDADCRLDALGAMQDEQAEGLIDDLLKALSDEGFRASGFQMSVERVG